MEAIEERISNRLMKFVCNTLTVNVGKKEGLESCASKTISKDKIIVLANENNYLADFSDIENTCKYILNRYPFLMLSS